MIPEAASSILASHPSVGGAAATAPGCKSGIPHGGSSPSRRTLCPRGAVDSARGSEPRGRPFESARGHGAGLAGREAVRKTAGRVRPPPRLQARRPRDQGSGVLNRQCAFESRWADDGAHVYGTTEYSFPVRIWLVLRNQSEKLTMRVQVPFPAGALISGRSHGSWPCLVRRWGVLRLISGGYCVRSNMSCAGGRGAVFHNRPRTPYT